MSQQIPAFSKGTIGANAIGMPLVCKDGAVRMCRTEQYTDGFVAFVNDGDGDVSNYKRYATSRKARNAAAKWFV